MRILFLGAGATGGYFGGRLADAGADVTFLVRPKRREQLARDGIRIESALGDVETHVKAITQQEVMAAYDIVILSTKAYDLAAAIDAIRPAVGATTLVMPLLNGMQHLDDLDAAFGAARVLGGTCSISVTLEEDGTIRHLGPFAWAAQGARSPAQEARSGRLHQVLSRAFDARHPADIIGAMWEKWILIATLAGSTCLMRGPIGEIVHADGGPAMISGMLDECCRVATASGHFPAANAVSEVRTLLTDPQSSITASMLRDMQRANRIEADHIIGDFIRRGREHRVPTQLLEVAYIHLQVYQNKLRSAAHAAPEMP